MQTIRTSLQIDNHASTSSLDFFTDRMLFLTPSQQCQSTDAYHNAHEMVKGLNGGNAE